MSPEGALTLTLVSRGGSVNSQGPMPRGRPARPAACPAALHGMIWMTRAFFMLAGRLPVLMFSFMIRTLVSFCKEDRAGW